jgi:hypothetical protein
MIEDITDISNTNINTNNEEENNLNIILLQTNYNREQAIERLNILNDPILVIKEYLNPNYNNKVEINNKSINQQIYSQIRNEFYSQKFKNIKQ